MADLIDRDAIFPLMERKMDMQDLYLPVHFMDFVINEIPSVNRWIPCSERLPESREDVLVWFEYFRYGEYNCMYQTYNIGNYFANHDSWMVGHETGWQKLRVIAWMPLPEPPESEVQK